MKTAKNSDFSAIGKNGVEKAKPQHYAQVQFAMLLTECANALYVVENKDTNELHTETVPFDKNEADRLVRLAVSIVNGHGGSKCSDKATHWQCKTCPAHALCHTHTFPRAHCLTCIHSAPADGGQWTCGLNGNGTIPEDFLPPGCGEHAFLPWTVSLPILDSDGHWVMYKTPDGKRICNAPQETGFPTVDQGDPPLILTSRQLEGKTASKTLEL
jgi:hypothetical protein